MPVYSVEVAIVCDDIVEDGFVVLSAITDALGIHEDDNIALEHGANDSGHPVLLATLSVSTDHAEEADDVSSRN